VTKDSDNGFDTGRGESERDGEDRRARCTKNDKKKNERMCDEKAQEEEQVLEGVRRKEGFESKIRKKHES